MKLLVRHQTLTKLLSYRDDLSFVNNVSYDDIQYLVNINQMSDSQREYIVQSSKKERFVTTVKIKSQKVSVLVSLLNCVPLHAYVLTC